MTDAELLQLAKDAGLSIDADFPSHSWRRGILLKAMRAVSSRTNPGKEHLSSDDLDLITEAIDLKLSVLQREKSRWPQFSDEVMKKINRLSNLNMRLKLFFRRGKP